MPNHEPHVDCNREGQLGCDQNSWNDEYPAADEEDHAATTTEGNPRRIITQNTQPPSEESVTLELPHYNSPAANNNPLSAANLQPDGFSQSFPVFSHLIPSLSSSVPHWDMTGPTMASSLFSFFMTFTFVGILWLIAFMIFGWKGHAIAGIIIGLTIVGLFLNACLLRVYIKLRYLLGIAPEHWPPGYPVSVNSLQREMGHNLDPTKLEDPPSYASIMEEPPPYSSLQLSLTPSEEGKADSLTPISPAGTSYMNFCSHCRTTKEFISGLCADCEEDANSAPKSITEL